MRARPSQPARTVKIEVLSGKALMPVPCHKNPWLRSLSPEPIPVNFVQVREVDAPEGITPIEWVLYTLLPVDTFEQLWAVTEIYEVRWLVEEDHKALKSGTRVTARQPKNAGRL